MPPDPRTTAVQSWSVREAEQVQQLTERTQQTIWSLFALWLASRWYSDADRQKAGRDAAALLEQSRSIAGNVGIAYIRQVMASTTGRQLRPTALALPPARLGADMTQVYARPIEAYRREFSVTGDAPRALTAARTRLDQLVDMDLQLARRDAELQALGLDVTSLATPRALLGRRSDIIVLPLDVEQRGPDPAQPAGPGTITPIFDTRGSQIEVLGYRRIVHPERSESGVCGLCLAASDRIYTLAELMPIHGRCKCTVAPITDEYDPGESNVVDLEQLYVDAGGGKRRQRTTSGRKLREVRYQVSDHGEYGLVLSRAGDRAQSTGEAPKGDPITRARKELAALEPVLANLERRDSAGDDVAAPLQWQRNRIAKLRDIVAGAAA